MTSLESTKCDIRSILVARSGTHTVQSLLKEYYDVMGIPLPFRELGYNSPEHLLNSIPDVCRLLGNGPQALVYLIRNEKTNHMLQMAVGQKKSPNDAKRRFRTGNIPSLQIPRFAQNHARGNHRKPTRNNYHRQPPMNNSLHSPGTSKSDVSVLENSFKKVEINCNNQSQCDISFKPNSNDVFSTIIEDREDLSNVPNSVQNNLKLLIKSKPQGIWCAELPSAYRAMFRKNLFFNNYGYSSLIDMCIALSNIFHYIRPGRDDFMLFDKTQPIPQGFMNESSCTISSFNDSTIRHTDDALPELNWRDLERFVPHDVLPFDVEIPRQFVSKSTKSGDCLQFVTVEVYSPSKFWVYLGSQGNSILDKLADELQTFYRDPDNFKEYAIRPGLVKEGMYCVQLIYQEYQRAKILSNPDNGIIKLYFIDFGIVRKVSVKGLCFLHSKFGNVPAQAIRAQLANICPVHKGRPWPTDAYKRFQQLLDTRAIKAKIAHVNWIDEALVVFLADVTDPNNIIYINEVMVNEGLALWDNQTQKQLYVQSNAICLVQEMHLYPTFDELERYLVPNRKDMQFLNENLVPLQFCLPRYFKIVDSNMTTKTGDIQPLENCFFEAMKVNHVIMEPFDTKSTKKPIDFSRFGDLAIEIEATMKTGSVEPVEDDSCEAGLAIIERSKTLCVTILEQLNPISEIKQEISDADGETASASPNIFDNPEKCTDNFSESSSSEVSFSDVPKYYSDSDDSGKSTNRELIDYRETSDYIPDESLEDYQESEQNEVSEANQESATEQSSDEVATSTASFQVNYESREYLESLAPTNPFKADLLRQYDQKYNHQIALATESTLNPHIPQFIPRYMPCLYSQQMLNHYNSLVWVPAQIPRTTSVPPGFQPHHIQESYVIYNPYDVPRSHHGTNSFDH